MTESVEDITTPNLDEVVVEETENQNNSESEARWTEGELLTFVRVRFPGNSKSFPFLLGKKSFSYGRKVVAMSDRGMDVGYINSFPYQVPFKKEMLPVRSISKEATEEDILQQQDNINKEKEAEKICLELIERLNLDMVITHVEIIQFGKKLVFYFTAPSRVDFRELVKQLVAQLKMRIELRQISVRDRAAALGSLASCGLPTCCSSFLQSYGNVSVKMAKNQNLALIPSKINGVCGQIKCCIKYENHVYTEKRKKLPPENKLIVTKNGDKGKVTKLHLFIEQFDMLTIDGKIKRYCANQFDGKTDEPEWEFPRRFDNIVNETQHVIGLELMDPFPSRQGKNLLFPQSLDETENDMLDEDSEFNEGEISGDNEIEIENSELKSDQNDSEYQKPDENRQNRDKDQNSGHSNNNRNRNRNRNKDQTGSANPSKNRNNRNRRNRRPKKNRGPGNNDNN